MATVAELLVKVGADVTNFTEGMKKTQKGMASAGGALTKMGKGMTGAGKTLTKFVTGPVAAAGAGLFAIVQKTANVGDEFQKMALRTGISTEALSELKHAAELSGTSIDTIEKGVKKMQKTLFDAEEGMKTAVDGLDAIGLSSENLKGLAPEQQFEKLTSALAAVEDPSRRAALAQQLFGKAGTEMLPMLAQGEDGMAAMRQEARDLGIVFDQEAADSAAQFNDDMLRLQKSFGGVFQELGANLLPILVDQLLPAIQDKVVPAIKTLADKVIELIDWFSGLSPEWKKTIAIAVAFIAALGPVLMVLGTLATWIGSLISLWGIMQPIIAAVGVALGAISWPVVLVVAAIAALIAIGVLLWKNWDVVSAKAKEIWGALGHFFTVTVPNYFNKMKDRVTTAAKSLVTKIAMHLASIPIKFKIIFFKVLRYLTKLPRLLYDKAKKMASSLWSGFKKALGIGSPSLIDEAFLSMVNSAEMAVRGLRSQVPKFAAIAKKMVAPIPTAAAGDIRLASAGANGIGMAVAATPAAVEGLGTGLNIQISQLVVREEADVEKIAQRLYRLQQSRLRAEGGRI